MQSLKTLFFSYFSLGSSVYMAWSGPFLHDVHSEAEAGDEKLDGCLQQT